MIEIILNFIARFYTPNLPNAINRHMDVWYNYYRSKWEQRIWRVHGCGYIHPPYWYYKTGDNPDNGARCSQCRVWVERKNENSLQIHEFNHYD